MQDHATRPRYHVGIDIGGTFTDLVVIADDGTMHTRKELSTPDDYGRGIVAAIGGFLEDVGSGPDQIERVVHATTVATNAILEHRGARIGLVTTRGFRDVLEMRRLRIPEMYALNYPRPEPLVPRQLRLEVDERIGPKGQEWLKLDEASVGAAASRLAEAGVEAVAVSLLHSYVDPCNEQRVAEILRERLGPGVFISCSSDILPVIREYERTSTTVINAFLGPTLKRYFSSLKAHLAAIGVRAPLQVMKSDGGIMTVDAATEKPAYIIESGPAAGVIGAARFGRRMKLLDCITLDMGGTTAKASMVEKGEVPRTGDYEVGAGINLSSKLVMGGGYALKLPVIDISEIGAGGGSIVSLDEGGLLRVGPRSAGSTPGPVAYGLGGTDPTFTDAVLTLGYLNPDYLVGGGLRLDLPKARSVLESRIAAPLGTDALKAAFGVYEVACGTMMRAVKAVSTYRGRDPRDFALFAIGGNGPVVAAHLAAMLDMREVIVPPNPGVFSAFGLLLSDIEQEAARGFLHIVADLTGDELEERYRSLENDLAMSLEREGYDAGASELTRLADLRYSGQAHELTVALPAGKADVGALIDAFGDEHQRTYGHKAEAEAVECVTLRVIARIPVTVGPWQDRIADAAHTLSPPPTRRAYFGPEAGLLETPVVDRARLKLGPAKGPLIVEEYDATCIVPPGWTAGVDAKGALQLKAERA